MCIYVHTTQEDEYKLKSHIHDSNTALKILTGEVSTDLFWGNVRLGNISFSQTCGFYINITTHYLPK